MSRPERTEPPHAAAAAKPPPARVPRETLAEALDAKTKQLSAVADAMTAFVADGDWGRASADLLRAALEQTGSEYGFVGVLVEGPVLRVLAHEGIRWDAVLGRDLYDEALRTYEARGYLEFASLDNLFGHVITDGSAIIANRPASDPRSGGLPPGHPPLRHFLGVPIYRRDEVIGLIGIANRPGGYTGRERDQIDVLCRAVSVLYDSYRRRLREAWLERRRRGAEDGLRQQTELARLLFRELDHRVRNNLAALTSLVDLTHASAVDVDGFARSIRGRIEAMSRAHSMLSQARWRPLPFRELVEALTPPECRARAEIDDGDLLVSPRQATAVAMLVHELLTNGVKHGALAARDGRLRIELRRLDHDPGSSRVRWSWTESGGPPITEEPEPGVGTGLIDGLIRYELQGRAKLRYEPDGARHEFVVTLEDWNEGDLAAQAPEPRAGEA